MNNKGKTMTSFVIALLAFVAVIIISQLANDELVTTITPHVQNDNSIYNSSLSNISVYGGENGTLSSEIINPLKNTDFLTDVWKSIVAVFTTAIIGLKTIKMLLVLPGMLNGIMTSVAGAVGLGEAGQILLWFLVSATTVWFFMKALQAMRGTGEPP